MALQINRDQLSKVFSSHREIVQFEEAFSTIQALSAEADSLSAQIQTAKQDLDGILGTLNLNGLTDVVASNPADKSILEYSQQNKQWKSTNSISLEVTDTTQSVISSGKDLTDFSGSSTVSLNTAPVSGDPSKWVAIDDNGTTRYFPTW